MRLAAILDTSAFIWDIKNFETNAVNYYEVMEVFPSILEKLKVEKIPIVMREELLFEIQTNFPYANIPREFRVYRDLTLINLSKLNKLDYQDCNTFDIECKPDLFKSYFSNSTLLELKHLIGFIYNSNTIFSSLLSFNCFCDNAENLRIAHENIKEIPIKICDDINNHTVIIGSLKKIFEHNPKHDKYKSSDDKYYGKVTSVLRCYNERIGNTKIIQSILDDSRLIDEDYYGFDAVNTVYIRFEHTRNNIYHGFEVIPDENLEKKLNIAFNNA